MTSEEHILPDDDAWQVSSYSGGQGNCVQVVTSHGSLVPVRDSKRTDGSVLRFSPASWNAFLHHLA